MAPVIQGAQDGNAVLQSGYVRLCAGQDVCACVSVCVAEFVRLGLGCVYPSGLVETHLNHSGLVPDVMDIHVVLCATVLSLTLSKPCVFLKLGFF